MIGLEVTSSPPDGIDTFVRYPIHTSHAIPRLCAVIDEPIIERNCRPSDVANSPMSGINQHIDGRHSFHAYKLSKKPAYSFHSEARNEVAA